MGLHDELLRAARRQMIGRISTTDRLIRQLYIRSAKAIEKQIGAAKAGSLTERWLTAYKAELDREIDRLGQGVYDAVTDGALSAAQDRVKAELEYLSAVADRGGVGVSERFTDTLARIPTDTLRAMIDGSLYTDGRMLSRRIWSEMGRLEGNISEIIQQGVARQTDALTLARQLEAYVDPDAACPVSWHSLYPSIPFDRRVDYNALRLARTSITHAHWIAGKAAASRNPLCAGMKWNLSNQHYERQVSVAGEDICDQYAAHDEGLGAGVFPVDAIPMPHPNCLCYQTEVLPTLEDAADRLAAWRAGANDPALESGFERWKRENADELRTLEEKWTREWNRQLDNSGETATMNLQLFAREEQEKDLQKQRTASIEKGIRSLRKRIEDHQRKLEDPSLVIPAWQRYSPAQQAGLIRHWKKEIKNFEASIRARENEMRKRGASK